jgi:lysozyme
MQTAMQKLDKIEQQADKSKRLLKQRVHRTFNTVFILCVLVIGIVSYFKVPEYQAKQDYNSEIAQIVKDEGLRLSVYNDSLGNATIGFGHLIKNGETFTKITPHEAIALLRDDYESARDNVNRNYKWAQDDVKLVLINMTFQLGPSRLAKFEKALMALQMGDYDRAASELLDSRWAKQAPNRAHRLAGRILQLDKDWW